MTNPAPCLQSEVLNELTLVGVKGEAWTTLGCPEPYALGPGSTVRGVTPASIQARAVGVDIPGETVTSVRATPATIAVPIIIHGQTEQELETRLGQLGAILDPVEGVCRIVWRRADGTAREITAYYLGGADDITIRDLSTDRHAEATLIFRAHFPYWQPYGGFYDGFNSTFSSQAFAFDVINSGDVRSWPEITITGPCENVEFANVSTGQFFRMREVLAAGQVVKIDTDPRNREVYLDDAWFPAALDTARADLFPLLPGLNHITFRALNSLGIGTWHFRWPLYYHSC